MVAAAAKSLQSCPTLSNPIDGSSPGSPVLGILQARTLEWGAIAFSREWLDQRNSRDVFRLLLLVGRLGPRGVTPDRRTGLGSEL